MMKKEKFKFLKKTLCILFFLISTTAYSQKLPNVQVNSLFISQKIKIDGKADEWAYKLQAYNKATEIFYSIGNDNDNLYLIIQVTKPDIIQKATLGGITFSIKNGDKKNDNEAIGITFPIYEKGASYQINLTNKPDVTLDTAKNKIQIDSFVNAVNQKIGENYKLIGVEGIKTIEPTISVYNEEKIKAVALVNYQTTYVYTYELSLPLKYLNLRSEQLQQFKYNIKLNGAATNHSTVGLSGGGRFINVYDSNGNAINAVPLLPQTMAIMYPTDFWGKYTLAKK